MLERNAPVPVTTRDRALGLAAIVFIAAMGGVWFAAAHPAGGTSPPPPVNAAGTFHTTDLIVDNTSTFSAMTASTMMTVNASKQLTPYAGATLSNDGGATVCSLAAGGTGNCNLAVVGGGTTNHIPIIQSAPPNNRSIGDSAMVYNAGSNLDVGSVKITSVSDPNASTDQTAATAHWITSSSASNFSATQGGTVPSPGAPTGRVLSDNGTWISPGGVTASQLNDGFGPGGDGAIVFDGISTVTIGGIAIVPAGSVYTLTTVPYASNITVNNGVTVKTAGYPVYATGTCLINGTVSDNGASATAATSTNPGAGGAPRGAGWYSATAGGNQGGINAIDTTIAITNVPRGIGIAAFTGSSTGGGAGGAAFSAGAGGDGGSAAALSCVGGSSGGGGGANIAAAGGNGTTGGRITLVSATQGFSDLFGLTRGQFVYPAGNVSQFGLSGTGGGGGAAGGASSQTGGGGGGAPGGYMQLNCRILDGTGSIQTNGGNGGNGACDGSSGHGCTAGGGGGGGGPQFIHYAHRQGSLTFSANGGSGGAGSGPQTGGGKGGAGGNGGSCVIIFDNISGDGT